jgi:hypothetical protein
MLSRCNSGNASAESAQGQAAFKIPDGSFRKPDLTPDKIGGNLS